jgi:hypothetical protein
MALMIANDNVGLLFDNILLTNNSDEYGGQMGNQSCPCYTANQARYPGIGKVNQNNSQRTEKKRG